ncbi:MAG: hypothetical protein ACPGQS_02905 [Bradymonadia bacterium]
MLRRIINTSGGQSSVEALAQHFLNTHRARQRRNGASKLRLPVDRRTPETNLSVSTFLQNMKPKAVFNRIDLAALDGAHCGEQRVVYSLDDSDPFTLIFESKIPNPRRNLGLAGCKPIARFWANLQRRGVSNQNRATRLAQLFFSGVRSQNVRIPAVVHFNRYRGRWGQIRSNSFVGFQKWQLREFRTHLANGRPIFAPGVVQDNPLAELYGNAVPRGFNGKVEVLNRLKRQFRNDLINNQLNRLMAPELEGIRDRKQILTGFSVKQPKKFYEFQSDAQGQADDINQHVVNGLRNRIRTAIPDEINLSPQHIINRLDALTCGGCHQRTTGKFVAPGIQWPQSLGFVHVGNNGSLSPALRNVFLPERKKIMESILCMPNPS